MDLSPRRRIFAQFLFTIERVQRSACMDDFMNQKEITEIILGTFCVLLFQSLAESPEKEKRLLSSERKIDLSIEHSVSLVIFSHCFCRDFRYVRYNTMMIERTYRCSVFKNVIDVCVSNQGATFWVLQSFLNALLCVLEIFK